MPAPHNPRDPPTTLHVDEITLLASAYEVDAEPTAADAAIVRSITTVGSRERLEFLSG